MKIKLNLFALVALASILTGCANQDSRYNVKNSWCSEQITPTTEKITLAVDLLFQFDQSSISAVQPEGKKQLDELVAYLAKDVENIKSIKIIGFTDRIGSNNYNYRLGLSRAETIKDYLIGRGINVQFDVLSKGKEQPVTTGCQDLTGDELKTCLQPDRRVELFIENFKPN